MRLFFEEPEKMISFFSQRKKATHYSSLTVFEIAIRTNPTPTQTVPMAMLQVRVHGAARRTTARRRPGNEAAGNQGRAVEFVSSPMS